jgi:uncharacterized pyridoxal phosphate-containing UPF0001 family protein
VGLAAIAYSIYTETRDWLNQRKQYAEACRVASENYVRGLLERIARLEEDLRDAAMRELGYLNERKITSARMSFMASELSLDDMSKKTQVLSR